MQKKFMEQKATQFKLEKITEASGSKWTGGPEFAFLSLSIQPDILGTLGATSRESTPVVWSQKPFE